MLKRMIKKIQKERRKRKQKKELIKFNSNLVTKAIKLRKRIQKIPGMLVYNNSEFENLLSAVKMVPDAN